MPRKKIVGLFIFWLLSLCLAVFITASVTLNSIRRNDYPFDLPDGIEVERITSETTTNYYLTDGTCQTEQQYSDKIFYPIS